MTQHLYFFRYSIAVTIIGLICGYLWGGMTALILVAILCLLEISLSFDNAVVNASVLKDMDKKWQDLFLTVGIIIAVFGMRLVFPIVIVAVAADLNAFAVMQMALNEPDQYSQHLTDAHVNIAAFGGMFLLLVFLSFLFNEERELHWLDYEFKKHKQLYWLGLIEKKLSELGKLESIEVIIALTVLLLAQGFLAEEARLSALLAGISGVMLFVVVDSISAFFENEEEGENATKVAKRSGVMGFIYLEILDASFSFDGVIGAFAITKDIVIIMIGLAVGAMFVRSITVFLVRKGTLDEYVFLEHGAHYAIGALAFIMLVSMVYHINELITGLIGVAFISLSVISSVRYKKRQKNDLEIANKA